MSAARLAFLALTLVNLSCTSKAPRAKEPPMIERLIGVNITDEAGYATYREKMSPLLEAAGGSFGVDLDVKAVLRAPSDAPMNRVFTIRFPDAAASDAFFGSEAYQAVRAAHFEPSVSHTSILGTYRPVEE